MAEDTEPELRIPWAEKTVVKKVYGAPSISSIDLEQNGVVINVDMWGNINVERDSHKDLENFMEKNKVLTNSLRRYIQRHHKYFIEGTQDWLRGGDEGEPAPWGSKKPGILDWWPGKTRLRRGKQGEYRSGQPSQVTEYWVGSEFPFVHIVFPDGEEALAVDFGKPEVWVGNVDGFFQSYSEDWGGIETFISYNMDFENGLLWALDQMDVFTKPRVKLSTYGETRERPIPDWALDIIADDPEVLWPELVEKLLPILNDVPEKLETAVRKWVERRVVEAEEATGQSRFWPRPKFKGGWM